MSRFRGYRSTGRWGVSALLLALSLSGLLYVKAPVRTRAAQEEAERPPTAPVVEERLKAMTLEEKVGQLFMVHLYGASADDASPAAVKGNQEVHGVGTAAEVIRTYKPGGVIYFQWTENLHHLEQIQRLSRDLQQLARENGQGIPLLIAIDQEHGVVQRIGPPATEFPGNMATAATGEPALAYHAARITGLELKALGININYAPVADVNVNPDNPVIGARSFGDRPEIVAEYVREQVRGFADAGVASAAKHFPGHGDTDVDSHTGLPLIDHTVAEVKALDLPPFQAAIDAGVDMVMSAHIVVPALDPSGLPGTLSHKILTELLREQMGFQGLVVTDALNMAGAQVTFDPRRVPVEALKAGADLLVMPPNLPVAFEAVLEAVRTGELSEGRIDESVRRILALKEKLQLDKTEIWSGGDPGVIGAESHWQVAHEIARKSVTVLRDGRGLLPITGGATRSVLVTGWGETTVLSLAELIQGRGLAVEALVTGTDPKAGEISAAVSAAQRYDLVIVVTHDAKRRQGQQRLAERLAAEAGPVLFAMVGAPYDATVLPDDATVVALYSYRRVSLEALVEALFGELKPLGRMPVQL